jgi:RNA methyltransferase, RsmE family
MNTIIFKDENDARLIPNSDPRAEHIRTVLKASDGDEIFAGIANGPLFKAKIHKGAEGYTLSEERVILDNPPQLNADIYVSFARPQITKRILFEAACFGVKSVNFYPASKGEADYAKSSLFASQEFTEHLIRGAEQACATNIPQVKIFKNLQDTLENIDPNSVKLAPDLYEATSGFPKNISPDQKISIVFGSERGFSNPDRDLLRQHDFTLISLGPRTLRTDTAIIAALALTTISLF